MRLVRTAIAEYEYQLLKHPARAEGKSMKEVAAKALRARLMPAKVNPDDPVFHALPIIRKTCKTSWWSRDHDSILYGRPPVIFVDASAWIALLEKGDDFHSEAQAFERELATGVDGRLVTTDYAPDEAVTYLRQRGTVKLVR